MNSKKESLAQSLGSGAGELAFTLFDKLKKNRFDTSSKIISNLATNIERKISSETRPSISLSQLLTEQDRMLESTSQIEKNKHTPEPKLEKSISEFHIKPKNNIVQSFSLNTPLNTIEPSSIIEPVQFTASDKEEIVSTPETSVISPNQNFFVPCYILALSILASFILKYTSYFILMFFVGFFAGIGACCAIFYLMIKMDFLKYLCSHKIQEQKNDSGQDIKNFLIQSTIRKEKQHFDGVYKGWMNELRENYSPESYFINKTRSVYLNLDGSLLRLQISSSRIPKRAFADEKIGHVQLNDLRIFELDDSEVSLLPNKLCRKRYWSRKYPICIKNCKLLNKKSESETDTKLILFARTNREKEEWYNLFKKASSKELLNSEHFKNSNTIEVPERTLFQKSINLKYEVVNDKIVYREEEINTKKQESDLSVETQTELSYMYDSSLAFMNTFLIRVFADFFYNRYWIEQVQTKIQNKLNKIRMPYFMEGLIVTAVDLGSVIPLIKQVSKPWYDEKGLWVHLDIDYNGSIQMNLATKLNLMKLKTDESDIKRESKLNRTNPAIEHSSEEDSPESSGDEYIHSDEENKLVETVNPSKKLMNIVNKIAASNYFQKATEMNFIKKAMVNVSNCQLLLNIELKRVSGTVALNIPPHPSDRVWYGFVAKPKMDVVATPHVGETEVSYAAISDFIAKKLKIEFQKLLVYPNMDDFYIPLLNTEV